MPPNRLYIENATDAEASRSWRERAQLKLQRLPTDLITNGRNAYFGGVPAVAFENGQWTGAADPRRDGKVEISPARE